MIDGVTIHSLRRFPDERGTVFHMLKRTDDVFTEFGEMYFTSLYADVIKAWHEHTKMALNYACILGAVKVVLYDGRSDSSTHGELNEFIIGDLNYSLLHIPRGVTNGMKGLVSPISLVANCATLPHEENEMLRYELDDLPISYDWTRSAR